MKKTILTGLLTLSILGLGLPLAKASSDIGSMREKYNRTVNVKSGKDYIDHDQDYNDGSSDSGTKVTTIITEEVCYWTFYDSALERDVYAQGRVIEERDEEGNFTIRNFYPNSFARKTNLGYKDGERNPNEFNDDLQGYLRTLIGDDYDTIGLSLTSFTSYLNFLQEDFGMYDDEIEYWIFEWKKFNNSYTEEEIEQIEKEKREEEERLKELEEIRQKGIKAYEDAVKESEKNKTSLFEKEASMIERSLPTYISFDRDKYIRARTSGMSYLDAVEYSQTVDKDKMWQVADEVEGLDTFENDYNSSTTIKESVDSITSKIGNFVKELFS